MKAKIINKNNCNIEESLKVLSLNYDFVAVQIDSQRKVLKRKEVQLIPENSSEKIISQYEDILKIKLDKGMAYSFYPTLINYIENIILEKIKQIEVLEDEFRLTKKGIIEKTLLLVINRQAVFKISAVGERYSDNLSFTIKELNLNSFLEECNIAIKALENEIEEKKALRDTYEKNLKSLINNGIANYEPILLKN